LKRWAYLTLTWQESSDFNQQRTGGEMFFMDAEKISEISCALREAFKVLGRLSSTVSYHDLG
jgi:hypothetical protein